MRSYARPGLLMTVLIAAAILSLAVPAAAHHTSLHIPLIPVIGTPPIVLGPGAHIEFLFQQGGLIRFSFAGAKDPATGKPISTTSNTLDVDLVVNGNPESHSIPFTITSGRGKGTLGLGLVALDLVEVKSAVLHHAGVPFGTMGIKVPGPNLNSALIQVFGTASDLRLALTRDADVEVKWQNGGTLTVRLDKVSSASALPVARSARVELEIAKNGVVLPVFEFSFNINADGFAKLVGLLHESFVNGDLIEVQRIDLFDTHDRFATLGVRIMSP